MAHKFATNPDDWQADYKTEITQSLDDSPTALSRNNLDRNSSLTVFRHQSKGQEPHYSVRIQHNSTELHLETSSLLAAITLSNLITENMTNIHTSTTLPYTEARELMNKLGKSLLSLAGSPDREDIHFKISINPE